MDHTDTCRTSYPKTTEYTSTHATFSMTDQMSSNKISLRKFSKTEIIPHISSDNTFMKLEINTRGKAENSHMWTSNNTQQTTSGSKKKSQEIIEHVLRQMKTKTQSTKTYKTQQGTAKERHLKL